MAQDQRADVLFQGGHVWTGLGRGAPVDAVAVRRGRIVAVGRTDELDWARGPRTRVIPLAGRLLLPAFIDSHVHPIQAGLAEMACQLPDVPDVATYMATLVEFAAAEPGLPWVTGEGWSMAAFAGRAPDRATLDAAIPDRPVMLLSRDAHSAWLNSAALAAAGIGRETRDPPGGRIDRDAEGEPLGCLHGTALRLADRHAPHPGPDELEEGLRRGQAHLHRFGVSAWLDAEVTPDLEQAYVALAGRHELTGRAVLALRWDETRGLAQAADLASRREIVEEAGEGRVRAPTVKLYADGVIENRTASLLEPYLQSDGLPGRDGGQPRYGRDELGSICVTLERERFSIHVHAIGDRAVRETLDALTAARKANGPRDARHAIAHLELVHPADLIRFGALGVVASCQPFWAQPDEETDSVLRPLLGDDRLARRYPLGSLARTGTTLALGSDWNVTTPDPLRILEVAITRTGPDRRGTRPLGPVAERLRPEVALRAYTRGSAFAGWLDAECGTIELGKAADLVLLDRDPLTDGSPFGDARVLLTLVDGRPVHEDPALDA